MRALRTLSEHVSTTGDPDPILDYPEVDETITNPRVLPLVSAVLGGDDVVRFGEFNIRVWPPGYGRGGMGVHHDATVPDRYSRQPVVGAVDGHSPPDYLQVFYCVSRTTSPPTT